MEYKTINLNTYNIHFIKTDKFKTIDIRVVFLDKFQKEDITKRNFLIDLLTYSTKKYQTRRMLNVKCQELYSLMLNGASFRMGNYLFSKIGVSFLNPKYTEPSMLEESIDLLMEVIFNPNICNKAFDKKSFDLIKKDLETELKTIKEQPRVYSMVRMLETMGKGEAYSYHGYCNQKDLDSLNEQSLYEYYVQFLKSSLVDIYVVGDFDFEEMETLLKNKFKITTLKKSKGSMMIKHDKIRMRAQKVIEDGDYKQSKLVIGLKLKDLTKFEERYVSNIYNMILGGSSDSFLMKNVREKASIAYYVGSSLNKADNLMIISSGIEAKNFDKAMRLIKKSLKDMREGNFLDDDISKSQIEYISSLDVLVSSPSGLMDLKMSNHLNLSDDLETRKAKIMKVTKKDVMDFSKKISLDTIYLLKGE